MRLIVIASGKGGVGKTMCAVGLAQARASAGHQTLLVDVDLGLSNVDVHLGLSAGPDLGDVLQGRLSLQDAIRPGPDGLHVLAGRHGAVHLAQASDEAILGLVSSLRGLPMERGFLDMGAGIGRAQRLLAACADVLCLVVTPDPASIADAYAVMKTALADGGPCPVILVNQASGPEEAQRAHATLESAARRFLGQRPGLVGWLPKDAAAQDSLRAQRSVLDGAPGSSLAGKLRQAAAALP